MGCATSKEAARRRAEKASWYAPVSRSVSAPIHYPAENEDDSCHVVSLASSSYGIMEMERPGDPTKKGSFVRILHDKHVILEEMINSIDIARPKIQQPSCPMKLQTVQEETREHDDALPETINTWELMEGLDEEESKTPSPLIRTAEARPFEKSISFSKIICADSQFSELGTTFMNRDSPIYADEMLTRRCAINSGQRKYGFRHHSSLSFSGAEEHLCGSEYLRCSDAGSLHTTPLKSSLRTPPAEPFLTISHEKRSPVQELESESPLFDPALMATFEEALQGISLPQDEWILSRNVKEESATNSSTSSGNSTWVMSESSSDAESCPQSESLQLHQGYQHFTPPSARKREDSSNASPWMGGVRYSKNLLTLESFEFRCPPRGEEKVVLYFTSLRGIRKTYEDCCDVRLILRGFGVHVDERDVWMHSKFREELRDLLESRTIQVPRLFIKGRYIGGTEDVKQLHEDGVLVSLIEDLPCLGMFRKPCQGCADIRFVPCLTCSGSCKVFDEMGHTTRCERCNENGLIMCPICT
ncbi:hypothetical protein KP509_38G045300 [Ceratopteris richardii]|uniref:Glutaredoxin domain-containing protein n=1 Tax=Ceratopteris richardii TaxID=49495 RepID=A0A8T2Q4D4_CERRI|nr:hypothetical protein KP509_38G045300 [Ceratopteris richardii]